MHDGRPQCRQTGSHPIQPQCKHPCRSSRAFNLLELVVVVVIIGVIAAIAIPRLSAFNERSAQSAFAKEMSEIATIIERFRDEHGYFPEEQGGKALPPEILARFRPGQFDDGMPYGGEWLYDDKDKDGIYLYAKFEDKPGDALMIKLDRLLDDGNLTTGVFIKKDDDEVYLIIR